MYCFYEIVVLEYFYMAEEKTTKTQKEERKNILIIIATVIIVAVGLYALSMSSSTKNAANKGNKPAITQAPSPTGESTATTNEALTAQKWMWVNTKMSDGAEVLPSAEGKFGLKFGTDMSLISSTDCNNGRGTYELGPDNAMTIGPMATTMMFCEGSAETQFFQGLNNVGSYKIENGQLWLMLKYDSGTMIFE
jgi:heat shock protein HslJ